ncbi:protein-disulfide isomerase [Methylobacterium oryzisoli]|uniref:protein-disulfide isomerase n=1 Tax=Methylobacterium oryzisoli TaxID=3385502 RepID=UPI0038922CA8
MHDLECRYLFDPLCGWCYASAPALAGLAERYGDRLRMLPVGLFVQPRPVGAIADHAWRNDQRIAALTGQPFSEAYHRDVLLAPDGVFTSGPLTLALAALGEADAALEPRVLHAAQIARYVDGRDTSRVEEVVRVAVAVAGEAGLRLDPDGLADRLRSDAGLAERVAARVRAAQAALQGLPGRGVPQLLVRVGATTHVIDGQTLYAGRDATLAVIARLARPA